MGRGAAVANVARLQEQGSVFLSVKVLRGEKIAVHVPRNAKKQPVLVPAQQLANIFPMATVATEVVSGDVSSPPDVLTTAWRQQPRTRQVLPAQQSVLPRIETPLVVLKNASKSVQLNQQLHGRQQTLPVQRSVLNIHHLMQTALVARKSA